ncbi:MAG: helix-turn-helix domain-containing protein [Legionella longbeachae]|nr:helix-turn-helix domain-containing protein [Legionella longbeachae]
MFCEIPNLNVLSQNMPNMAMWLKDENSVFQECNETASHFFSLKNRSQIEGMTDFSLPCKISELAPSFQAGDNLSKTSHKPVQFLEFFYCTPSNQPHLFLVTKSACIQENGALTLFGYGCDITILSCHLINLLNKLSMYSAQENNGSYILGCPAEFPMLTNREKECLFFLTRGYPAKKIAQVLHLSPRTVEDHIGILRQKFGSDTKFDLINTAFNYGFLNYLPTSLFEKIGSHALTGC